MVDGFKLVEEALKSSWEINQLIINADRVTPEQLKTVLACKPNCEIPQIHLPSNSFGKISSVKNSQGIIAVVKLKKDTQHWHEIENIGFSFLCVGIRDPRNLGLIFRVADALGINNIFLSDEVVEPYNSTCINSSMGSIFHIDFYCAVPVEELIKKVKKQNGIVYSTTSNENKGIDIRDYQTIRLSDYQTIKHQSPVLLILGNEGSGLPQNIIKLSDAILHIPIFGKAESLNVAVAAAVLGYYIKWMAQEFYM